MGSFLGTFSNLTGRIKNIEVNGYKPYSILNIILAVIAEGGIAGGICFGIDGGDWLSGSIFSLVGVGALAILIIRSLRMRQVGKIILHNIILLVSAIVILFIAVLAGSVGMIGVMNGGTSVKQTYYSGGSNKKSVENTPTYTANEDVFAQDMGFANADHANRYGYDTSSAR